MKKYVKKRIVIEAEQWFHHGQETEAVVLKRPDLKGKTCKHCNKDLAEHGFVGTLEGFHIVCPGDWIIKGIAGEFYPCKPDIFKQTYDPVED